MLPGKSRPRSNSIGMGKKLFVVLSSLAVLAGAAAPATGAGKFKLWDCIVQSTMFQIPAQQAQKHLPQGFTVSPGPAGNTHLANAYVESWACGADPKNPMVVAAFVSVPVLPPEDQLREESSHRFILQANIGGYEEKKLARELCATELFDRGEIQLSNRQETVDIAGGSIGSTSVSSEELDVEMNVGGPGYASEILSRARMFYEARGGVDSFDLTTKNQFLSLGPGRVSFTQPFLDFPSSASGLGQHSREWVALGKCN